jgi:hypothetical protein
MLSNLQMNEPNADTADPKDKKGNDQHKARESDLT